MSEFIETRDHYGRDESFVAVDKLGAALAKELGAVVESREGGTYPQCALMLGDLRIHLGRGANKGGKWSVHLYAGMGKGVTLTLSHYSLPKFPSINIDPTRPLSALAKDIKRRLIDPSAEPVKLINTLVVEKAARLAEMARHIASLTARFPQLNVAPDGGGEGASVSNKGGHIYLSARINSGGSISIDRLGSLTQEQAARVFDALFPAAE